MANSKNAWAKVIRRAWADSDFKARLIATPSVVLAEYGLSFPENTVVVEDENASVGDWRSEGEGADKHVVIPIPPVPPSFDSDITDSALSATAGGSSKGSSHVSPPTCVSNDSSDSSDSSDASDASDGCTCSTCA